MAPTLAPRFVAANVSGLSPVSIVIAVLANTIGLIASFDAGVRLPTGPAIVLAAGLLYLVSMLVGPRGGLLHLLVRRRHLEA